MLKGNPHGPTARIWGRMCPAHPNPRFGTLLAEWGRTPAGQLRAPSRSHFAAQLRSKWPAAGPGPLPISHARSGADNVPKALGGLVPSTFPGAPLSPAAPLGAGPAGTPGTPPAPARPRAPSSCRAPRPYPVLPRFGVGARGPGGLLASATPFFLTPGPPGTQGGVWYVPARPHSPNWSRLLRRRRRSAGTGVGPAPMLQRLVAPQRGHVAP